MHILLLKEILLLLKKTFTANDFDPPNNTVANATATNTANDNAFGEKKFVFKNNAPFISCISKINGVKIDVTPMYNLLEYSKNYKKITGSLWNYYKDEPNSSTDDDNITHSILNSESSVTKPKDNLTNNNL